MTSCKIHIHILLEYIQIKAKINIIMNSDQKQIKRLYLQKYLQNNLKTNRQFSKIFQKMSPDKIIRTSFVGDSDGNNLESNMNNPIKYATIDNESNQDKDKIFDQCRTNSISKISQGSASKKKQSAHQILREKRQTFYKNQPSRAGNRINLGQGLQELMDNNKSLPLRLCNLEYMLDKTQKNNRISDILLRKKPLKTTVVNNQDIHERKIRSQSSRHRNKVLSTGHIVGDTGKVVYKQKFSDKRQKQKWLSNFKSYLENLKKNPKSKSKFIYNKNNARNYSQFFQYDNKNQQVPNAVSHIHQQYLMQMAKRKTIQSHEDKRITTQRSKMTPKKFTNKRAIKSQVRNHKIISRQIMNRQKNDDSQLRPWNYETEEY